MRPPSSRPVVALAVLGAVGALGLAGCSADSGGSGDAAASDAPSAAATTPGTTATPSQSASSTVAVPADVDLTDQGSELAFGDPARVVFETTENRGTVLQVTVRGARRGRLSDFKGYILDDPYKQKAAYYYARVTVRNVGEGDVGGVRVPVWGLDAKGTLLPSVTIPSGFKPCRSAPLPAKFAPGAALTTCLVYLVADHGALKGLSYRPSQQYDPISWTGTIARPAPVRPAAAKSRG
jgi:hypothetical protein